MASRVNTRFVVVLAVALGMVFVLTTGVFYFVKMRSGDRYARLGDEAVARGDLKAADEFYARAVAKERTNVPWLMKWRDVRAKRVPETETEYLHDYQMYTQGILNSLAKVQRTDVKAQCDYLQAIYDERSSGVGANREGWENLIEVANESLAHFDKDQPVAIRRYRGFAVAGLLASQAEVTPERLQGGQQDLEAAIAADPADTLAANQLVLIHRLAAVKAQKDGKKDQFAAEQEQARKIGAATLAASPGDPRAVLMMVGLRIGDIQLMEPQGSKAEQARARRSAIAALQPLIAQAGETILAAEPSKSPPEVAAWFYSVAMAIDGAEGIPQALAVVEHSLKGAPQSAELLMLRARLALGAGKPAEAIDRFEDVLKLPKKAISLDGIRLPDIKRRAQFEQASAAVSMAATSAPEARAAALERAREYRGHLAQMVAEHSPELVLIDAKIKLIEGDLRAAQALLADFLHAPGDLSDQITDAYLFIAEVAMRLDPPQPGLARDHYRLALKGRPDSVEIRLALAAVEFMLENRAAAITLYDEVLELQPQNETALRQRDLLAGRSAGDPVLKALVDADAAMRGSGAGLGDDKAARAILENALEPNSYDNRLVKALVPMRAGSGDKKGAQDLVAAALKKRPEDPYLLMVAKRLEAADSPEKLCALIDESGASELDKLLAKRRVYETFNLPDKSDEVVTKAAEIAPENGRVLELLFVRAIKKNDLAEADRIVERAVATNADRADGTTFRARRQIAQGNIREAAALLDQAAKRGNANPAICRMLGATLLQIGRGPEAVAAFRKGVDLDPSDLQGVKAYVQALVQTGQKETALGAARQYEMLGRRDPEFVNLWLALEADAGRTQFARERREEMLTIAPGDTTNALTLAELYIRDRMFDKARARIDAVRTAKDSIEAATADARWHSAKGDLEKARQVFVAYIDKAPEAERGPAYVAFAQFMMQAGNLDLALSALGQAAMHQEPKTMSVDVLIGDTLLQHGRFAEAEAQYRKLIAAGIPDKDLAVRKRLIEALTQLGKNEDAEKEFASLGPAADGDVELMVQHAQILRQLGRTREAREALDRAIARFPDEPLPYMRRARLVMTDPAFVDDALADLGTAVKVRPGYWQALRARAQIYWSQRKFDDALKDMQAAVDAAPGLDELRWNLVDVLLNQNRDADAAVVAEAGMHQHPNDLRYMGTVADRFARAGRWGRAAGYYQQMLRQVADEGIASACVNAYLSMSPPNTRDADAVFSTPGLNVEKSPQLLLARAAVRKQQGKEGPMRADLLSALELAADPPGLVGAFEGTRRVVANALAVVQILDSAKFHPGLEDWVMLARATTLLDDPKSRSESCARLESLARDAKDPVLRTNAARAAVAAYANDSKWEEAVAATRLGLTVAPDDVLFNNNLAFILSENLKKADEALPYAEKAFAKAEGDLNVTDTVASVYWRHGDRAKAIAAAESGLRGPRSDADKAPLRIKVAGWKLQTGDLVGARALLDSLRETVTDEPTLSPETKGQIEQLKKDIDAAH